MAETKKNTRPLKKTGKKKKSIQPVTHKHKNKTVKKRTEAKPKGKAREVGRPSKYTKEIADKICKAISTSNKGLITLCKEKKGFPNSSTIYNWLNKSQEFLDNYTRAREEQADFLADEIIELSDKEKRTKSITIGGVNGLTKTEQDNPARTRLQIDARKWKASKLYPKRYGDKVDLTSKGESINKQVDLSKLSTEDLIKYRELNNKLSD